MRFVLFTLACVLAAGCEKRSADPTPAPSVSFAPPPAPRGFARRPKVDKPEGGASREAVLERALTALEKKEWDDLVRCWSPDKRDVFAKELVFQIEFAAMGEIGGEARQLLDAYGVKLSVEERMRGLELDEMSRLLHSRLTDRDAFLADLLAIADRKNVVDPVVALESKQVMFAPVQGGSIVPDTEKAGTIGTPKTSSLGRAVDKLRQTKPPAKAAPSKPSGGVVYLDA
jgi:hypothetical protein